MLQANRRAIRPYRLAPRRPAPPRVAPPRAFIRQTLECDRTAPLRVLGQSAYNYLNEDAVARA